MNIADELDEKVSTRTQSSATPKPHHYTTPLLYHTDPFCHHHPLWLTPPHHHYHSHHRRHHCCCRRHHCCWHRHQHHHQLITFTVHQIYSLIILYHQLSAAFLNKCSRIIWMSSVLYDGEGIHSAKSDISIWALQIYPMYGLLYWAHMYNNSGDGGTW